MNSLKISIAAYLTTFFILIYLKPLFCFTENNEIKPFGIQEGCTLYTIYNVSVFVAIIFYFFSSVIYLKN